MTFPSDLVNSVNRNENKNQFPVYQLTFLLFLSPSLLPAEQNEKTEDVGGC